MCGACGGSWLGASAGTRANRGRDGGERDQDGERDDLDREEDICWRVGVRGHKKRHMHMEYQATSYLLIILLSSFLPFSIILCLFVVLPPFKIANCIVPKKLQIVLTMYHKFHSII